MINPENSLKKGTELLSGKYRITSAVGRGGSAFVYSAEKVGTLEKFIIKELYDYKSCTRGSDGKTVKINEEQHGKYEKRLQSFVLEADRMAAIDSPILPRIMDYFYDNNTWYIAMLASDGFIPMFRLSSEKIKMKGTISARLVLRNLLKAVWFFHEINMVHCDIKPENLLVNGSGEVKLIDLGSAVLKRRHSLLSARFEDRNEVVVTRGYSAPELSSQTIHMDNLGFWTDLYSAVKSLIALLEYLKNDLTQDEWDLIKQASSTSISIRSKVPVMYWINKLGAV